MNNFSGISVTIIEGVIDEFYSVYLSAGDITHRILAILVHYDKINDKAQEFEDLILKEDIRLEGSKIFWYLDGKKLRQKEMEDRLRVLFNGFLEPIKEQNPEIFL